MKNLITTLVLLGGLSAQANHVATTLPAKTASKATATKAAPKTGDTVKVVLTKDNTLVMNDYYDGEIVANVVQKAKQLDGKLKSNDALFLIIDSGGGSIDAGIEMIENLNNLNRPVHTLTIFAASMGFQTVQGVNGKRLILSNGTLMSHKARGEFYGEFPGQLDSRYAYYLARVLRLDKIAAGRTNGKYTLKTYQNLIENEYWCDGRDCINNGFADFLANASCDASMNGKHNKLYDRFLYMGHVIEIIDSYADCPLITSPLSWNVLIDGEPLFQNSYEAVPEKPVAVKVETSNQYGYYSGYDRPVNVSLKDKLGLETIENIKKLITKKLDARKDSTKKDVRKY